MGPPSVSLGIPFLWRAFKGGVILIGQFCMATVPQRIFPTSGFSIGTGIQGVEPEKLPIGNNPVFMLFIKWLFEIRTV